MNWQIPARKSASLPPSTWTLAGLIAIGALACSTGLARLGSGQQTPQTGQVADESSGDAATDVQRPADGSLFREGTEYSDTAGRFIITGDRVEFRPRDGGDPFLVLENLALQRVQSEVFKLGGNVRWDVKGVLTEYQGRNYLLIRRAVIASAFDQD